VAFTSIWISLACMIAAFDMEKALDEDGKEIPLSHKYSLGLIL
jgi:hypothetical protein